MQTQLAPHAMPRERLTDDPVRNACGETVDPGDALPCTMPPIPTALAQRELDYLHWLAASTTGSGRVVELGCFLGGSTAALVHGMARSGAPHRKLITYDAFIAPELMPTPDTPAQPGIEQLWSDWRDAFDLEPGEHFRQRFDRLHARWLDQLVVREGWLPKAVARADEPDVYPEQDDIELLFVDVAKTWEVHLTVLRAFARHLRPGSTLVQQDFFDAQTPWIPLHMFQLRHVFEPLDAVRNTPTLALRCVADPTDAVELAWTADDLADPETRRETWDRVHEYWCTLLGPKAAGFVHGHAATHAINAGDAAAAVRSGRRYEAWLRSSDSIGMYVTTAWDHIGPTITDRCHPTHTGVRRDAQVLADELKARTTRRTPPSDLDGAPCPHDVRCAAWRRTAIRLTTDVHRCIALFGAGDHTDWLLNARILPSDLHVACILDDDPKRSEVAGVPVRPPADAAELLRNVSAILPSSDAFEGEIMRRAHDLYGDHPSIDLIPVYTQHDLATTDTDHANAPTPLDPDNLPSSAPFRRTLGLPTERDWLAAFAERYVIPGWVEHPILTPDALLLWDLVEATRPQRILEIGTSSGTSTALLAAAADHFMLAETRIATFDTAGRDPSDIDRPIGSAIRQMAPDLLAHVSIHPHANTADAARTSGIGETDLVLINTGHDPWCQADLDLSTALDVLAVVYAIRPRGWIAIRTPPDRPQGDPRAGLSRLFDTWPSEKVSPSRAQRLGVIRMLATPSEAAAVLTPLLTPAAPPPR